MERVLAPAISRTGGRSWQAAAAAILTFADQGNDELITKSLDYPAYING